MKKHSLITVLAAALVGVSAAGFPAAPGEPAGIVAEAAESNGFQYTVSSNQVTITGYTGSATSVTIPSYISGKKVIAIANDAFRPRLYPNHITSITIPNTVQSIGSRAFAGSELHSINIPASVQTIGNYAFQGALSLTSVVIQGAPEIKMQAFQGCSALQSLEIKGAAQIGVGAFRDCTALYSVKLHKDTIAVSSSMGASNAFNNCTSLTMLNGQPVYREVPDDNGYWYPMITSNQNTRKILRNVFYSSTNVKFMKNYSIALCNYIVDTETKSWMSDILKARALYDWLIKNCDYEHGFVPNTPSTEWDQPKNHQITSVFFGYGVDGCGETVCEGYAKAYTMLLKAAGIESYVVVAGNVGLGLDGHAWNLIKIGDNYYECDVTYDEARYNTIQQGVANGDPILSQMALSNGTSYGYFMQTDDQMAYLHLDGNGNTVLGARQIKGYSNDAFAEYISYDVAEGTEGLNNCIMAFNDTNCDGLLDNDWDFNATVDWNDYLIYSKLCAVCNVPYLGIQSQPDFLANLLICNMSATQWAQLV